MPAKHPLPHNRRLLHRPLQEVDEGVAVVAVEAEGHLLAGHRHLLHVLRELDLWLAVDLHELIDTAERRLPLAGDYKRLDNLCES